MQNRVINLLYIMFDANEDGILHGLVDMNFTRRIKNSRNEDGTGV